MTGPGVHYCSDSKSYPSFLHRIFTATYTQQTTDTGWKQIWKQTAPGEPTSRRSSPSWQVVKEKGPGTGKAVEEASLGPHRLPAPTHPAPVLGADGGTRFLRLHIHCSAFIARSHCLSQTEMKFVWNVFLFPQSSWLCTDRWLLKIISLQTWKLSWSIHLMARTIRDLFPVLTRETIHLPFSVLWDFFIIL